MNDYCDKLLSILKVKPTDWRTLDEVLDSIPDINIFYDDTILTDIINEANFVYNESLVLDIINHFLDKGYDLKANGGKNGAMVLEQLCWKHISSTIDILKSLLDKGCPTDYDSDQKEHKDYSAVLNTLDYFSSGSWGPDCDYSFANILEACIDIVEAYEHNKDYTSINSYEVGIGKKLTSVSLCGGHGIEVVNDGIYNTQDSIILWFGEIPLVINRYLIITSNGLFVKENEGNFESINNPFAELIGGKLVCINYINSYTCCLEFDNGKRLVMTSKNLNQENRSTLFEIRDAKQEIKLEDNTIISVLSENGIWYAEHVTMYSYTNLVLLAKDCAYIIAKFGIAVLACSPALLFDNFDELQIGQIKKLKYYYNQDGDVDSIRVTTDKGYLYIISDTIGVEYMFSNEKIDMDKVEDTYIYDIGGVVIERRSCVFN